MYHLEGNPTPSDQTLFRDLLQITTSKWQSMLKKNSTATPVSTPPLTNSHQQHHLDVKSTPTLLHRDPKLPTDCRVVRAPTLE